uniref:nucleoside-diphosphate kinase n=1 Tax=Ixodes ricinus TaxID=34613 RepID=A0A090XEK5_IXORI
MVVGILMAMYASPSAAVQERRERTFMIVKPDGVQRGLIGKVVSRFEKNGFKLVAMKFLQATEDTLKKHYEERSDQPFFHALINVYANGTHRHHGVGRQERHKEDKGHHWCNRTPVKSNPGTIRGDYDGIVPGRKVVHGSDSLESSKREIELWFEKAELIPWMQCLDDWIFKEN